MKTLKRFIHYYAPYRAIFFLDLLCATVISAIDLAYPQILRTLTNTLFTKNGATILHALGPIAIGLFLMYVLQSLCKYYVSCQGHDGRPHGAGYAPTIIQSIRTFIFFLL